MTTTQAPDLTRARQVADAVLYEGYLLYPYRATSSKNQVRWQFGVLGPAGASEAGVGEPTAMSAGLLLGERPGATLDLYLRFLQVQARIVERWTGRGWERVDVLQVGGARWIPFHEAVSREVAFHGLALDELAAGREVDVSAPSGEEVEELYEGTTLVGRLIRTRWALHGTLTLKTRPGRDHRVRILDVTVDNHTWWFPGEVAGWTPRDIAARYSFVGAHLLMAAEGTRFISLIDGPDWSDADAKSLASSRCWPGLIATDDGRPAVLVSPIILGDYPAIAPESAGDLFDATEIDEILTLRVMTMTDDEKAAARGTDPRAAAILSRCDGMSDDALRQLHGGRRHESPDEIPWWDEGQDARAEPETDCVLVNGVPVAKGSRVLLRPSRRSDAQDIFLAGMTAVVSRVYFDVDGNTHVAVMLEDDPAQDIYDVTGRYYYFGPEEIEPLPARASS